MQRAGRSFQDRLLAKGFGALLAAINHFPNQRGPADVAHALARYGSLAGASFGLSHLVAAPEVGWWKTLRKATGWSQRGKGSLEDVVIQVRAAAETALTDAGWRALDEVIDRDKQAFLTLVVPMRRQDRRWRPLVAEIEHWLDNQHPHVTALWTIGNGTPLPDLAAVSPYWIQATLFAPLPDTPRAIQTILDRPSLLRRVTPSAIVSPNGALAPSHV